MHLNRFQTFCLWTYRILPAVALLVLVVLMIGVLRDAAAVKASPGGAGGEKQVKAGSASPEAEKYEEEVKLYLEWIIAIAGIFTIAQTIAAGYTAQAFSDQAEKSIKDINTLEEKTGKDLERFKDRYQNVVLAEDAREDALEELRKTYQTVATRGGSNPADGSGATSPVGWLDWRLDLFGTMELIERQRLLSIDRYLGFDLQLGAIKEKGDKWNIIRLMANFYVGKFDYEVLREAPNWMDLERAEYLLRLGIRHLDAPFWFHNDLGLVLVKYADRYEKVGQKEKSQKAREMARQAYDEACRMEPRQQRGYYNRARIAKDLGEGSADSLKEAIALSEKAIAQPNWEIKPVKSMQGDLVYNLACYKALLAFASVKDSPGALVDANEAEGVLELLEKLALEGTTRKKIVDDDFAEKGDFYDFKSRLSEPQEKRLTDARPKLSAHQPPE